MQCKNTEWRLQKYRMYYNDVIKAYSKIKIVNGKEEEKHDN